MGTEGRRDERDDAKDRNATSNCILHPPRLRRRRRRRRRLGCLRAVGPLADGRTDGQRAAAGGACPKERATARATATVFLKKKIKLAAAAGASNALKCCGVKNYDGYNLAVPPTTRRALPPLFAPGRHSRQCKNSSYSASSHALRSQIFS